jgi:hypothetical protein
MDELGRLLLLIGCTGLALTALGVATAWWMEEGRRLQRGLRRVLGVEPQALLIAPGRGKGAAFDFNANRLAVAWDSGGWGLAYRFEELVGAELILDGQVAARVHRRDGRRALDAMGGASHQVRLRLVFADVRWPDFDLDLWMAGDEGRKGAVTAADAVQEANRWLARVDAILQQPIPVRQAPPIAPVVAQASPPPQQAEPKRNPVERDFDDEDDPYGDPPF